jgi:hypothetical protein
LNCRDILDSQDVVFWNVETKSLYVEINRDLKKWYI